MRTPTPKMPQVEQSLEDELADALDDVELDDEQPSIDDEFAAMTAGGTPSLPPPTPPSELS